LFCQRRNEFDPIAGWELTHRRNSNAG